MVVIFFYSCEVACAAFNFMKKMKPIEVKNYVFRLTSRTSYSRSYVHIFKFTEVKKRGEINCKRHYTQ